MVLPGHCAFHCVGNGDGMRATLRQSKLTLPGFAFKNVWRRRLRASLTLCGIAMGIAAFVALVGFSRSYEQSWLNLYEHVSSGND